MTRSRSVPPLTPLQIQLCQKGGTVFPLFSPIFLSLWKNCNHNATGKQQQLNLFLPPLLWGRWC